VPHEGSVATSKMTRDKFIFSTEDMLDERIASDPGFYKIYLRRFLELLDQLYPSALKAVFANTYAELCPYYADKEIISMSEFDAYKDANIERLENDMFSMYSQLRFTREIYLKNLREDQSAFDNLK
jgi:hypothetical protein